MSTLTAEALREMMRQFPAPRHDDFFDCLVPRASILGRKIYDAPPPLPKIQVRQIYLKDGTALLPQGFLDAENAWWLNEFGYHEDIFRDKVFLLGSYGIVCRPQYRQMITSIVS